VGFEAGQSSRMWSPTGLNTPHPLKATHCMNILYFDIGDGGYEPERRLEGQ